MRIASFQSVRIEQFAGHLVKEFRVVQHFLDFLFRAAVVEKRLHLVGSYAECFRHAEQIVITSRRVLVVAAVERIFSPPVLECRMRRECAGSDTAVAVDLHNFALLRFQNIGWRF